jgi:hypothetical protein
MNVVSNVVSNAVTNAVTNHKTRAWLVLTALLVGGGRTRTTHPQQVQRQPLYPPERPNPQYSGLTPRTHSFSFATAFMVLVETNFVLSEVTPTG